VPGGSDKGAKTLTDPAPKCSVLTSKTYKDAIKKTGQNLSVARWEDKIQWA